LVYPSGGTATSLFGSTQIKPNRWYHYVATYDGAYYRIYLNGLLDKQVYKTGNNLDTDGNKYISDYFDGQIEEVAIWNRALSASEILELYRKGISRLDLNVYSCSDENCFNKTSSVYLSDVNNNEWVNLDALGNHSRYFGFDAYFKKAIGVSDLNAESFFVGSFIKDVNVSYSSAAMNLFARTSDNGYSWTNWSEISLASSPQTLLLNDANFFQYKSVLSSPTQNMSLVLHDVNVSYSRIIN
jgi:hypothetical protein